MREKHAGAPGRKERRRQINLLCTAVGAVGLEFSAARNALYGLIDAVEIIVRMLSRQSCAEAASEELRESRKRAPTADWLLMKVRGVLPGEMGRRLRRMLRRDVRRAMSAGAIPRRPVVAIDKTYIARYSEKAPPGQLVGRFMPGTSKAEAYISAKVVGGPAPLHVACRHVPPGEPLDVSVRKAAFEMRHCGIRPGTVLADREFGTAAGMREPGCLGLEYLMPVARHAGVKAAVHEHMAGRRPAVSWHTVRAGRPGERTYKIPSNDLRCLMFSSRNACGLFALRILDFLEEVPLRHVHPGRSAQAVPL